MFFRRPKPEQFNFDQRVASLKSLGFTTESIGGRAYKISRNGYAAIVSEAEGKTIAQKPGLVIAGEIGYLTNAGYQMFFRTDSGVIRPARAEQLHALHEFTEDLKEGLG